VDIGELRTVRRIGRRLLGHRVDGLWDRRLARGADVCFVGFPKVGNTWTRYLVGCYVQTQTGLDEPPLFDRAGPLARPARHGTPPRRLYFTHGRWEVDDASALTTAAVVAPYVRARAVLLVRHPLDTLVSMWHHDTRPSEQRTHLPLDEYVEHHLPVLLRYHGLWATRLDDPALLLCRYEDTTADAARQLERLLRFCRFDIDDAAMADAVARSSFDAMQALETSGQAPVYTTGFSVFAADPTSGERHVRRGAVGGWRDELDATVGAELAARVAATMDPRYGYGDT
jgi:hypothetical protein